MEKELQNRPSFMLFGFLIRPDELPPEPLKPLLQPHHPNPNPPALQLSPPLPSSLPTTKRQQLRRLLAAIGAAEDQIPVHFFTRTLYPSDVKKGLTRLTLPRNRLLRPFLSEKEDAFLQKRDGNNNNNLMRLQVEVIDPSLVVRTLTLSRWNYKKPLSAKGCAAPSWSYALNGGWMDVVDANGLAADDTVQLWLFRKTDSSPGFIIFKELDKASSSSSSAPSVDLQLGLSSIDDHQSKNNGSNLVLAWCKKRKRGSNQKRLTD